MSALRPIVSLATALAYLTPASAFAQTTAPPMPVPTAFVDVDGDPPLVLETSDGAQWVPVCAIPCRVEFPLERRLRVRGPGFRPSVPFVLDGSPGRRVTVLATPGGSTGGFIGGIVATSLGGGAVLVGGFVWLTGAVCGIGGNSCGSSGLEAAGVITVGAGLALLAGGIVLLATNPRSTAAQLSASLLPAPPSLAGDAGDAQRLSAWHDVATPPTGFTVPLLSRRF